MPPLEREQEAQIATLTAKLEEVRKENERLKDINRRFNNFMCQSVEGFVVMEEKYKWFTKSVKHTISLKNKLKMAEVVLKSLEYVGCPDCGNHSTEEFYLEGRKYLREDCPNNKKIREALTAIKSEEGV